MPMSLTMKRILVTAVIVLLAVSCSSSPPTVWDQGVAAIRVDPIVAADGDDLIDIPWTTRQSKWHPSDYCIDRSKHPGEDWVPDLETLEDIFGGEQTVDVRAPNGSFRLTLHPPAKNWNPKTYFSCSLEY